MKRLIKPPNVIIAFCIFSFFFLIGNFSKKSSFWHLSFVQYIQYSNLTNELLDAPWWIGNLVFYDDDDMSKLMDVLEKVSCYDNNELYDFINFFQHKIYHYHSIYKKIEKKNKLIISKRKNVDLLLIYLDGKSKLFLINRYVFNFEEKKLSDYKSENIVWIDGVNEECSLQWPFQIDNGKIKLTGQCPLITEYDHYDYAAEFNRFSELFPRR